MALISSSKSYVEFLQEGGKMAADTAEPSAISKAQSALNEAKDLAYRVSALVDRTCGTTLQLASKTRAEPAGDLFSGLRDNSESALDAMRLATSQLNRLERELSA